MKKNLKSKVLKSLAGLGLVAGYLYATSYCANYFMNNSVGRTGNKVTEVTEIDGAFGHTTSRKIGETGEEVHISRFLGQSRKYTDGSIYGELDGKVDWIYFINNRNQVLNRNEHYEEFKADFEEADREFAKTKERFSHYFKDS